MYAVSVTQDSSPLGGSTAESRGWSGKSSRGQTLLEPPIVCRDQTENAGVVARLGNADLHWE